MFQSPILASANHWLIFQPSLSLFSSQRPLFAPPLSTAELYLTTSTRFKSTGNLFFLLVRQLAVQPPELHPTISTLFKSTGTLFFLLIQRSAVQPRIYILPYRLSSSQLVLCGFSCTLFCSTNIDSYTYCRFLPTSYWCFHRQRFLAIF